jgi:hypothetical protein
MVGSPVIVDLDGDAVPEVVTPIGWDLVGYNHDGSPYTSPGGSQLRLRTLFTVGSSPAIADVDNNGRLDIILGSAEGQFDRGRLYRWELAEYFDENATAPWAMFRSNSFRSGTSHSAPSLLALPTATGAIMLEDSPESTTRTFQLRNGGGGSLDWRIIDLPRGAEVSAMHGTVEQVPVDVEVRISPEAFGLGQHTLEIVIEATSGGVPVIGSPMTVRFELLVVDRVVRVSLPLIKGP